MVAGVLIIRTPSNIRDGSKLKVRPVLLQLGLLSSALFLGGIVLVKAYELFVALPADIEARQLALAKQQLYQIQINLNRSLAAGDLGAVEQVLSSYSVNPDINHVVAADDRGTVIAATRFAWKGRDMEQVLPGLNLPLLTLVKRDHRSMVFVSADGESVIAYGPLDLAIRPGEFRAHRTGTIVFSFALTAVLDRALARELSAAALLPWAMVVVAAIVLMLLFLNLAFMGPVRRLNQVAAQLADGDLSVRTGIEGRGELGNLARQIDDMSVEIQRTHAALQEEVERHRRSLQILEEAQSVAHVGSWEWSAESERVSLSTEAKRLVGVAADSGPMPIEICLDMVEAGDRRGLEIAVSRCREHAQGFSMRLTLQSADGAQRNVQLTANAEQDQEGRVWRMFGTLQDIDDQLQSEKAMIQAQRMDTVGKMAGGIAHDFNNLLGIINGSLDLIETLTGDARVHKRVESGRKAVGRGSDLTRKLLHFSRYAPQQDELVDVNELIQGMQELDGRCN